MNAGDLLTVQIETLAYGGDGLARAGGQVVFVPETAPGDTVLARVTQVKRNYARAAAESLLAASPDRAEPCCRAPDPDHAGAAVRVPGCVYDHLDYAAELRAKQRQLEGFLRRLAPPDAALPLLPALAAPAPLHYRNKVTLHAARAADGGARLGYRLEPSHRVLDLAACPLAAEPLNRLLAGLRAAGRHAALPDGARVTLRHTPRDGALWWSDAGSAGAALPEFLTEESPAGPLRVPRDGFYQVNPAASDALVRQAASWFGERPETGEVLDLYCGVGVFGFACLAAGGRRLTGVESGRTAVAAARMNARALGLRDASFHCCALGRERADLRSLVADPARATALVDPPREGLAPEVIRALADLAPARLFYISCDPATLARDLAALTAGGRYRLARARLFDLFPRTAHFETLAELARA